MTVRPSSLLPLACFLFPLFPARLAAQAPQQDVHQHADASYPLDAAVPEPTDAGPVAPDAAGSERFEIVTPPLVEPAPEDVEPRADSQLSAVVVTGTRRADRTVFDSNVPVDVVTANDMKTTVSSDINDKLMQTVPSYNVQRLPLADGAIFNRPATLRGLSPDQTLVLINGKRRHRSAYIDVTAQGAQAVDLAEIPQAAIERIEVLRDGASAQYGSDAIAGVVNIILRDKPGYDSYLQFGRFYAGDGNGYLVGSHAGWKLGGRGNLNISAELGLNEATSRSNQRPDAAALAAGGNPDVKNPVTRFGLPDSRSVLSFVNGKYRLGSFAEAYVFGSFGYRWGENDFNYRNPRQGSVFTSPQTGATFERNFASLPQSYRDWYNNNPAALSGYNGGFTPRFSATSLDGSAVGGLRGDITDDLRYDLSARFGRDHIAYHIRDTLNASQGPDSGHAFDTGTRAQTEVGGNLDLNYLLDVGLTDPINVAVGAEVRRESYDIGTGDADSYAIGDLGRLGLAGGANGFFGTGPRQAGTWGRHSGAGYLDVDADLLRWLNLSAAVRAEKYSDAGSTVNGKVSSRINIIEQLNLRGAVSSGFRAPTPGQQNLTNTNQLPSADGSTIETNGTIPSINPIAGLKGGKRLTPERSLNISFGFVARPLKKLTFSADAYRIDVRDRIGLSKRYTLTADEQTALVSSGVDAAQGLTSFNFFVNGYKTRTQGLDLVLAYKLDFHRDSALHFTAAANLNRTKVLSFEDGVIDARQRQYLEKRLPRHVESLSIEYLYRGLDVMLRSRSYGKWTEPYNPATDEQGRLLYNQSFGAEVFFDVLVAYQIDEHFRLTLGAENVLNSYPARARFPNSVADAAAGKVASNGRRYPSMGPWDSNGGHYYARLNVTF